MTARSTSPERTTASPAATPAGATTRRGFLGAGAAAVVAGACPARAEGGAGLDDDRMGVLTDLTECVGCRRCEWACCEANALPHGELHEYDDQSAFDHRRHPSPAQLTVVNRAPRATGERAPVHLKVQCMHCDKPACVSACLVGAMRKDPDGPVRYDAARCIGCRYCMVACPFEVLTYEYDRALAPRVRKCELCHERTREGKLPACVEICPVEALTYAPRRELLEIAHARITAHPDRYIDHVYGEHEAGGTSWLYIAGRDFKTLGFPSVGDRSPASVTESIQHGVFRGFAAPVVIAGMLAALHRLAKEEEPR